MDKHNNLSPTPDRMIRGLKTVPSEPESLRRKRHILDKKLFLNSSSSPGPGAYYLETTYNVSISPFSIKKECPSSAEPSPWNKAKRNLILGVIPLIVSSFCPNLPQLPLERRRKLSVSKMHLARLTTKSTTKFWWRGVGCQWWVIRGKRRKLIKSQARLTMIQSGLTRPSRRQYHTR